MIHCGTLTELESFNPKTGEWIYHCTKCGLTGFRDIFDSVAKLLDARLHLPMRDVGVVIHCGVPVDFDRFVTTSESGEWSYRCDRCGLIGFREIFDPETETIDQLLHLPMHSK